MTERLVTKLFDDRTAAQGAHASVQEAQTSLLDAGNHMAIQLDLSAGTATVELYGRLNSNLAWVLFDTIFLSTLGFLRTYDAVPHVGAKITAIAGGGTCKGWVMSDD